MPLQGCYTITKQFRTETAHRLMNYSGRCSHNHGHSYLWEVTATAEQLDDKGMVADFKDLKAAMKKVLDPLDHATVLNESDPFVRALQNISATNGAQQRLHIVPWNPTAENFAAWAAEEIQKECPLGVIITKVRVWETATSFAVWEIAHG